MSNYLSPYRAAQLQEKIVAGVSMRNLAVLFQVSINTVARYKRLVLNDGAEIAACKCGEPAGHKGWCSYTLEKSKARQNFLQGWVGKQFVLAHLRPKKQPRLRAQKDDVLLYPFVRDLASEAQQIVMQVYSMLPRGFPEEIRGDLCQDILLAVTEGLVTFERIEELMPEFSKVARAYMPNHHREVSIFEAVPGMENERIVDTLVDESEHFTERIKFASELEDVEEEF